MATNAVTRRLRNRMAAKMGGRELGGDLELRSCDGNGDRGGIVLPDRRQQRARELDRLDATIRLRMTHASTPLDVAPVLLAVLQPTEVPTIVALRKCDPTSATTTTTGRPSVRHGRLRRQSPTTVSTASEIETPRDSNLPTDFPSYWPLLAQRDVCRRLRTAWLETGERGTDGVDSSRRIQRLVHTMTRSVLDVARACLPAAVANEFRRIRAATLEAIVLAGAAADDLHATPIVLLFACQETVVDLLITSWSRRDERQVAAAARARIDVSTLTCAVSSHAELLAMIAGSLCDISIAQVRRRSRVATDGVVQMSARDRFQIGIMRRLAVADFRVAEFGRLADLPMLADAHVRRSIDVYRTLFGVCSTAVLNPLRTWYAIVQSQTLPTSDSSACLTVIVDWIAHCLWNQPGHFKSKVENLRRALDRVRATESLSTATTATKKRQLDGDSRSEVRICRNAHLTVWETFAAYFLTLDRSDHLAEFWQHAVTTVAYGAVGRRQVFELMKVAELRIEREMSPNASAAAGSDRTERKVVFVGDPQIEPDVDGHTKSRVTSGRARITMTAECRHLSEIALARSRLSVHATPRRARNAIGGLRLAAAYHRSRVRAERLETREFELESVRAWTDVLVALLSALYVLRAHSELLHLAATTGIEALHALHVLVGAAPKPPVSMGITRAVDIWSDLSLRVKCILWLHARRPTSRAIETSSTRHSFDNDILAAIRNGNVSEPCMPWHGELVEVFSYRLKAARRDGS